MIMSSFFCYSDGYILFKVTVTGPDTSAQGAAVNSTIKNCAPFTSWITEINNKKVDYAEDIDIVIPIYNLRVEINVSACFSRITVFAVFFSNTKWIWISLES